MRLTDKQEKIYNFIKKKGKTYGREIAESLGYDSNEVYRALKDMYWHGSIDRSRQQSSKRNERVYVWIREEDEKPGEKP